MIKNNDNKFAAFEVILTFVFLMVCGTYWGRSVLIAGFGYTPEFFLAPVMLFLIIFKFKNVANAFMRLCKDNLFLFTVFVLVLSNIFSIFIVGDPKVAYTQSRSILIFVVVYLLYKNCTHLNPITAVLMLCAIVVSYYLYFYYIGNVSVSEDMANKSRFPIWPVFVAMLIFYRFGLRMFWFLALVAGIYFGIYSNYRLYIVIIILGGVISIATSFFKDKSCGYSNKYKIYANTLLIAVCVVATANIKTFSFSELLDDDTRYSQLVTKSEAIISVAMGSKNIEAEGSLSDRAKWFSMINDNFIYMLLPTGLGNEKAVRTIDQNLHLSTIDSGMAFCAIHFGIVFGFIFFGLLIYELLGFEKNIPMLAKIIWRGSAVVFVFYFFVTTEFLSIFELAVANGFALGVLRNRTIEKL